MWKEAKLHEACEAVQGHYRGPNKLEASLGDTPESLHAGSDAA
jgi:hypothetical protein